MAASSVKEHDCNIIVWDYTTPYLQLNGIWNYMVWWHMRGWQDGPLDEFTQTCTEKSQIFIMRRSILSGKEELLLLEFMRSDSQPPAPNSLSDLNARYLLVVGINKPMPCLDPQTPQ
jgi:hypothetical protein